MYEFLTNVFIRWIININKSNNYCNINILILIVVIILHSISSL